MNIAIYLFDLAEELDWAGPWEVLSAWARGSNRTVSVYTVANAEPDAGSAASELVLTTADGTSARVITCAKGLRVLPDHTWETAPDPDVILIPGGDVRGPQEDQALLERLRTLSGKGVLVTSVCNGAGVLATAGLLDGKPATTHWGAVARLREMGIDIRAEERFVDAGDVITSAGVSAGIDMALYLVSRLDSLETAREVRRYIQYDPAPPV